MLGIIFRKAQSNIRDPAQLRRLVAEQAMQFVTTVAFVRGCAVRPDAAPCP